MRFIRLATLLAALIFVSCGDDDDADSAGSSPDRGAMLLATTTSTRDSGLLDELLPSFERKSGCQVKTVAVGSGEALELGAKGDADVLLVHSPAAEEEFMDAGDGASRKAVMHNDFVLVGPADDPADIEKATDAPDALKRIAAAEANFASRADESGTHTKELSLWETAGTDPSGSWYIETGQGMGETLTIAGQKEAYTLSDRGTFLATENLDAELLVEGGEDLLNPYHVIVVRGKETNAACAREFSSWITSPSTQKTIGRFGVEEYGERLFFPDAQS
ncbi:MAG TPA: substrate-binding domain-containing protein [Thermoleophilaceae bacterium]|jgi:tungstate transport system substrate-binding protein|nr:substrate-binding domain-containing protein [Thermoleophilaceae bacterium]